MEKSIQKVTCVDITPESLRCPPPACPAIYDTSDGNLLIVGKKPDLDSLPDNVRSKIGTDEEAIIVPVGFLKAKPRT